MAFAGVSKGLSFVLCMIRNLKIMCSKAVECLQKLKGSSPFFSFSFFEEREYQRSSTDNLNEWTCCNTFLGHRGSFMSCMAYAWNISPCGGECVCECVCALSIITGADECEVKHIQTSSMSLTVSCWASPSCHTRVKERVGAWSLHNQFWPTRQDLKHKSICFF